MEAVILIGIQGSGKSTFYKERFFATHIRISNDMLKTRHRERVLIRACIEAKQPFVIDKTNVAVLKRAPYIAEAHEAGFKVAGYYLRSGAGEALGRNELRSGKERVPVKGVLGTLKRLELPSRAEGFDELYYVTIKDGRFNVEDWKDEV